MGRRAESMLPYHAVLAARFREKKFASGPGPLRPWLAWSPIIRAKTCSARVGQPRAEMWI
jgi:hypothetical protein